MSAWYTGRVRFYEEPRANISVTYGLSFPKYDDFTDDFLIVGLSVNWPIAKFRLDRAKRDQAMHKVNQLKLEEQIINDQLDVDVQETHAGYLKAVQRVESKELELELADENLRLSRVYREHGQTDTQEPEDVFQVVVNGIALAEARMGLVKVKYEAYGLLADLYQRMGAMDEMVNALVTPAAAKPEPAAAPVGK
jgi:outer membrane protein TolC